MAEIRTARLVLRQWRGDDLAPWAALNADPLVMAHFPSVLSRGASNAYVARERAAIEKHGYGLWAVEVDGELAGSTGLRWTDVPGTQELEVGWRFARRFWGRGLATEAATAALAHGLTITDRVVSFTAVSNERSWLLMQRIGMRREREFDHPSLPEGHRLRRHVLYAC